MDGDSILYVNQRGAARTCWLHRLPTGKLKVKMAPGFIAEAPAGWHEEPE